MTHKALFVSLAAIVSGAATAQASEADALAISANIQARHLPFLSVMDPIFSSSTTTDAIGYTRCGDSALWTGAYLAAESFHYAVTRSPDALKIVKSTLAALKTMSDLTGDNRLARCIVLQSSPFAAGIASEEAANGINPNPPWFWVDNTSRDQIVGAFFGLCIAYDLVDDPDVKTGVSNLVTLLIGYISRHQWSPNDDLGSTFQVRPEELQMLLRVARHVNPANTVSGPFFVLPVGTGVALDVLSTSSYFKFNLDYMTFYHLLRLDPSSAGTDAYMTVRTYTQSHQNPFFNMIDRALRGPDSVRDAETRALLNQWLQRPRRDFYVDLSNTVANCNGEACLPIPVTLRSPATFLWEVDPFQLKGGGSGTIENAGVDYILPYWMARYYGVIGPDTAVHSSAAPTDVVAPGSLASLYGQNLAAQIAQPGITLTVTDSAGASRTAPLNYVSPGQINFLLPDGVAPGAATFTVSGNGSPQSFTGQVQAVAPTLFTMTGTGSGVAAALAVTAPVSNPAAQKAVPVFDCESSGCTSVPLVLSPDRGVYLSLYGTGIRHLSSQANVTVSVGGVILPVLYAGAAPVYPGLDQVNVQLPVTLQGLGECNVILQVDGQISNYVTIHIQ